jgi:hypothetical protein
MEFERAIPGSELFLGDLVDTASLLDRDHAAPHGSYDRGLATDDPPLGVRMWQLLDKPCPGHRLTGGRFHQAPPSSTGAILVPAGSAPDRTGRKDSCMPAASLFYGPAFLAARHWRLFHDLFTIASVLSSIFWTFREEH